VIDIDHLTARVIGGTFVPARTKRPHGPYIKDLKIVLAKSAVATCKVGSVGDAAPVENAPGDPRVEP
jgi:hypothetical protein